MQYLIVAFAASFFGTTLHFLALLAIATLTALCCESTGLTQIRTLPSSMKNPELLQRVRGGFMRQSLHDKHVENHARKYETLHGKKALLQMWEEREDCDHEYLPELRRVRN